MRLWRVLAVATAAELAFASAVLALAGLAGAWNGWLDAINVLAPLWLAFGLAGALGAALLIPPSRARAAVIAAGLAGALAASCPVAMEIGRNAPLAFRSRPMSAPLRVLTLNAWKDNVDPETTLARIRAARPDVVAVQEWQGPFGRVLPALKAAYPSFTRCRGRAGGLLVASRLPQLGQGCFGGPGPRRGPEDIEAVWLTVRAPDGRPATIVTTHIGWPVPPGRQAAQMTAFAALLKPFPAGETIVTGDFNAAPWTFAMRRQDRRIAPLIRRSLALPSWPARIPRLESGFPIPFLPIDHIYAGPAWTNGPVERVRTGGSDHYALAVDFRR
jgi:endonuclease/exonuclease/phosphatase (EEP) superfamily protein YafD